MISHTLHFLGLLNKFDGITLFIDNNCMIKNVHKNIIDNFNSIEFSLVKNYFKFLITAIYRSPSNIYIFRMASMSILGV